MYVLRILLWIWLSLVGRCGRTVSLHSAPMCALRNYRIVGPRLGHTVRCFAWGGTPLGSPRRRRHHRATSECRYCVMHHSSAAVTPGGAAAAVWESPIVALVPSGFPLLHFKFVGSEYSYYCCIAVWILRRPFAPTRQGGATTGCKVSRLPASNIILLTLLTFKDKF